MRSAIVDERDRWEKDTWVGGKGDLPAFSDHEIFWASSWFLVCEVRSLSIASPKPKDLDSHLSFNPAPLEIFGWMGGWMDG